MSALPFGRPGAARVMNYISPRALGRTGGVPLALWVPIWLPNRLSSPDRIQAVPRQTILLSTRQT